MTERSTWRLIESGPGDAFYNMAIDEAIGLTVMRGGAPPTLRFYTWEVPSVSLGAFQRIGEIDYEYCRREGVPVVRRPTGGRAILHDRELTYSFSAPNLPPHFERGLLEAYRLLSRAFFDAFRALGLPVQWKDRREKGRVLTGSPLCFQSVSYGEVTLGGKKVMGSAQKRWKEGFLQQGSIQFRINEAGMVRVFREATADGIRMSMTGLQSFLPGLEESLLIEKTVEAFSEIFGVSFQRATILPEEKALTEGLLREKYRNPEWTFRR